MNAAALVGERVRLSEVREGDLLSVAAWYEEAASAAYEERSIDELRSTAGADRRLFAITQSGGEEPIGVLEYQRDGEWLAVTFIALAKAYRGWGYGSEAVRLLEEWAVQARLADRFRAEVDVRNGLGLYFWLRLGYRPGASAGNGRGDVMTMVREIETGEG